MCITGMCVTRCPWMSEESIQSICKYRQDGYEPPGGSVWFDLSDGSLTSVFHKGNQVLLTAELSPQPES